MKDYFADALRSEIPARSLEDVFIEKEAIARSIDHSVADKMLAYGYTVVATLITAIREKLLTLPDATVVYSGHGPATTVGIEKNENPYL